MTKSKKNKAAVLLFVPLLTACAGAPKILESTEKPEARILRANKGSTGTNYHGTGYPSPWAQETHKSTLVESIGTATATTPSDITVWHDPGVTTHVSNTGTTYGSSSSIKLTGSGPIFDFTNANWTVPSAITSLISSNLFALTSFKVTVTKGSTTYFHASASIPMDTKTSGDLTATYDRNGSKTTETVSSNFFSDGTHEGVDPAKLGSIASSLYSGDYTMKTEYTYYWARSGTAGPINISIFLTTATSEIPLIIDYTKPSISATRSNGTAVTNGSKVNSSVTIKGSDSHFDVLWVKKPGDSSYTRITSSSYVASAQGEYSCYATDTLGNKSDTLTFTVDTQAPTAKVYADGNAVPDGSYINTSFSYSATDAVSGVKALYMKGPKATSYVPYSSGSVISKDNGDGWYSFYAVDEAGNKTATTSVFLETKDPSVTVYRNGSSVLSETFHGDAGETDPIYVNEGDEIQFGYSSSSNKGTGAPFDLGKSYVLSKSSYADTAYLEQVSSAVGYTIGIPLRIVRNKPTFSVNGKEYGDGSSIRVKDDVDLKATIDSAIVSGTNSLTVVSDEGTANYDVLKENQVSLTAKEGETKTYSLTLSDAAGNVTKATLTIDKEPAVGSFTSDSETIENGGYTNKPFLFRFDKADATATCSKDGSAFASYSGEEMNEDGSYTFLLTDSVGNTSEYRIVLDTVAPEGHLYVNNEPAENGAVTSGTAYLTWDGDATGEVNGKPYEKNTLIDEEGNYQFTVKDKAGNVSTYQVTIDRTAPKGNSERILNQESLTVTRWYECTSESGRECFKTEAEALERAVEIERANNVTELTLNDISDFHETGLVASNGDADNHDDEVRTGTYWLYKSKTNPDIRLYYFDENLLNDVLAYYASSMVSGPHYCDGTNHSEGEKVRDVYYAENGESAPLGNHFSLTQGEDSTAYAVKRGDSKSISLAYGEELGNQIDETGIYDITETDAAGNSFTFAVAIDKDAPKLKVNQSTYGESREGVEISKDTLPETKTLYLKSLSVMDILDGDSWAVLSIDDGNVTAHYVKGDTLPTLTTGGEYQIRAYDRSGNELAFKVIISDQEETIAFANGEGDLSVSIDITLNEKYQSLTLLEIYRNGTKLSGVSPDRLSYVFDKDGLYKVVLKDNFGRTVEKEYRFTKALPEGTLSGVTEGGKTAGDVSFGYDATKYRLEVWKNGTQVISDSTGSLTFAESGSYELRLINLTDEENVRTYRFAIDKDAPSIVLEGADNGGVTNGSVKVSWSDEDVSNATYSKDGGEAEAFVNGQTFDAEGTYEVLVTDELGNESKATFTIDKTVDYSVSTASGKKLGGDATTSEDVIITANEEADVTVLKDGEKVDYAFGDRLTEEGTYLITVEDAYGNKNSFTIVIDKSVDLTIDVADGGITNGPVEIDLGEKATVTLTKDGQPYAYTPGEKIAEEGSYVAVVTDAYGNSRTIRFQIVSSDPKQAIDYTLGEDAEIISVTKDGEEIAFNGNKIRFTEDGTYVITYKAEGKTYSFTLRLDTTAPEVTLHGVENGGDVDGAVTIDGMTEEGTVEVYKDGQKIDYTIGDELKDYGSYRVVVKDSLGNERVYTFTLSFHMNGWAVALVTIGVLGLAVGVSAIEIKPKKVYRK